MPRHGRQTVRKDDRVNAKKQSATPILALNAALFAPGDRVCIAVSGGADSTALLRLMAARRQELGLVLSVLHVEHGLRGEAAQQDAAFVSQLAASLAIPCETVSVDTPARAALHGESIEEAARWLRYEAFRKLLAEDRADRIATAHTRDDQAETVMMKLLRGAWTEGLSGIAPELRLLEAAGRRGWCVRPLLATGRAEVEAYLRALGQPWREDASNASDAFTRNRVRHALMPLLRQFNPRADEALAHVAECARIEEQFWTAELDRILPRLLLPGRPVRGGGRRATTETGGAAWAIEILRLRELEPALQRRLLRAAAERCGATLDFAATERLAALAAGDRLAERRLELAGGVRVERTARELQFSRLSRPVAQLALSYPLPIPGSVSATAFGATFHATAREGAIAPPAVVRAIQPGDRIRPLDSARWKRPKELLERMNIDAGARAEWPVVAWQGEIIWVRGVPLAPNPAGIAIEERAEDWTGPPAAGKAVGAASEDENSARNGG
jgi:tRNA(Ile)-lysidine synthase